MGQHSVLNFYLNVYEYVYNSPHLIRTPLLANYSVLI